MRLINCHKVNQHHMRLDPSPILDALQSYEAANVPKYAILSHTWEKIPEGETSEVTVQEFKRNESTQHNSQGWEKIRQACRQAQLRNLDYIWIDSCCIDKTNVTELSEAINSMYQWYSGAAACFVYLSDWEGLNLGPCRWFKRGWTLQELVAPRYVHFYNSQWAYIGSKDDANRNQLAKITGIDRELLGATSSTEIRYRLSRTPVCQRMSWASKRETTKIEDEAYCLLGIFDIQMPLLYGEGETAFIRLQQRIAETTNDLTLFAWRLQKGMAVKHNPKNIMRFDPISKRCGLGPLGAVPPGPHDYHGILACSPREFASGGKIRSSHNHLYNPEFSITNKGIRICASVLGNGPLGVEFLPLNCKEKTGSSEILFGIFLKWVGGNIYARAFIDRFTGLTEKHMP
ncbi:heterokaryon incompatibility protein-domain-containing protein [Nemania sp. FL0031]|nr:heterokaryon incompatibility protein-domain-containing protein [Nemania sp. FL0031]